MTEYHVTDEVHYLNRRNFIKQSACLGVGLATFSAFSSSAEGGGLSDKMISTNYGKELMPHSFKETTNYNNFYEFGTGKRDPAKNAHTLKPKPWHIKVSGECLKQSDYDLED